MQMCVYLCFMGAFSSLLNLTRLNKCVCVCVCVMLPLLQNKYAANRARTLAELNSPQLNLAQFSATTLTESHENLYKRTLRALHFISCYSA